MYPISWCRDAYIPRERKEKRRKKERKRRRKKIPNNEKREALLEHDFRSNLEMRTTACSRRTNRSKDDLYSTSTGEGSIPKRANSTKESFCLALSPDATLKKTRKKIKEKRPSPAGQPTNSGPRFDLSNFTSLPFRIIVGWRRILFVDQLGGVSEAIAEPMHPPVHPCIHRVVGRTTTLPSARMFRSRQPSRTSCTPSTPPPCHPLPAQPSVTRENTAAQGAQRNLQSRHIKSNPFCAYTAENPPFLSAPVPILRISPNRHHLHTTSATA